MKKDVQIKARAELIKVWVDGVRVTLKDGDGTAKASPGNHAISWVARGAAGTKYSLQITAPDESKLSRGDTFDNDQFDAGVAWLKVNAS